MRKSKITAAIITRNEEKNIRGCIESVKGWADEIIVVDGSSEDATVAIAKELGAHVIDHPFEGDFSKERNIAMANATGGWVLHIDADDRVTPDFKRMVDSMIDEDPGVDVYKFRRKSFFLGHFMRYGGWYHYVPNLARRGAVSFEGVLHERPVFTNRMGTIEADIEHHPFESISQFVERHNRYSSIEAQRIFSRSGVSEKKNIRRNITAKTFKIFWKIYIKKKGYKEGTHGFIFAVLFAFVNFLVWAKYWEICLNRESDKKRDRIT